MGYEIKGLEEHLRRLGSLEAAGSQKMQGAVVKTTLLMQEFITDYITQLRLVDTGFYRSSWSVRFPKPGVGELFTNCEYGALIEYGFDGPVTVPSHTRKGYKVKAYRRQDGTRVKAHRVASHPVKQHVRQLVRKPHYVARTTAVKGRRWLNQFLREAIKELIG